LGNVRLRKQLKIMTYSTPPRQPRASQTPPPPPVKLSVDKSSRTITISIPFGIRQNFAKNKLEF
jgi:hypothetical protein